MVPEVEVISEPVVGPSDRASSKMTKSRTTRLHITDYLKMMGTG